MLNRTVSAQSLTTNRSLLITALLAISLVSLPAHAQFTLTEVSSDTFGSSVPGQHASEVEPDLYGWGNTLISGFQVARISSGGGADVGFATSTNAGKTWTNGLLPGLTVNYKGGSNSAASDAAVVYDAAHGVWLICTLPIADNDIVAVSRSTNGLTWSNPITITNINADKNWITCDNTPTSPFYGHCYVEFDSPNSDDLVFMTTSTDGGQTWGTPKNTADTLFGIGGQPLVQPNGTVVVPIVNLNSGGMSAFSSTDGGATWGKSVNVADIIEHEEAGGLRSAGLPTAGIDAAGIVYLIWSDCRFRQNCTANDLVLSTSSDGNSWTEPARIPVVPVSSAVDLFIPGLGVDPATSGSTAHLALTTYAYSNTNCTTSTCELYVGFSTSPDGGKTWTAAKVLAGPMKLTWLPNTFSGLMVADYLGTSYVKGQPFGVFAVAKSPSGSLLNQAMYTTTSPLVVAANEPRFSSAAEKPVPGAKSDKPARKFYDLDNEYPIPPPQARRSSKK
jgi:hypothetical protein